MVDFLRCTLIYDLGRMRLCTCSRSLVIFKLCFWVPQKSAYLRLGAKEK